MDPTDANNSAAKHEPLPTSVPSVADTRPEQSKLNQSSLAVDKDSRSPLEIIKSHPVGSVITLTAIVLSGITVCLTYFGFRVYDSSAVTRNSEIERSHVPRAAHDTSISHLDRKIELLDSSIRALTSEKSELAKKLQDAQAELARQESLAVVAAASCQRLRDDLFTQESAQEQLEKVIQSGGDSTIAYQAKVTPQREAEMLRELDNLRRRSAQLQQNISQIRAALQTCSAHPSQVQMIRQSLGNSGSGIAQVGKRAPM